MIKNKYTLTGRVVLYEIPWNRFLFFYNSTGCQIILN